MQYGFFSYVLFLVALRVQILMKKPVFSYLYKGKKVGAKHHRENCYLVYYILA